ncbi:MAG: ABC transporter permease, partial [Vicinamibacteria bacterium]
MIERLQTAILSPLRSLTRAPWLVLGAVVTLAISVGINLAMVGLIDRALLSPPALVSNPEQVFTVAFATPGDDEGAARMTSTSYVTFKGIRDQTQALKNAAAFQRTSTTLMVDSEQSRVDAMLVSGGYFATLGASASLGRPLIEDDDHASGSESAAVLSHPAWRRLFGSDPAVVGRRIKVGGLDYVVVGVMPESFSGHSATSVDLWTPFSGAMRNAQGWDQQAFRNIASIVVRVADVQLLKATATQLGVAAHLRVALTPIAGASIETSEKKIAWWLGAVAALVFAIGLANAATLLTVRGSRLRHNMSIRVALGASQGRLIYHAVLESVAMGTLAVVASVLCARPIDEAIRNVLFPDVVARTGLSGMTLWSALAAAFVAIAVITAANVSQLPRTNQVQRTAFTKNHGARRTRTMNGLLITQTALATVLLAGAGLFGASLYRLWDQDFGMRLDHVMVVDFEPGGTDLPDQDQFFTEALARVEGLPGVEVVTPIDSIPFAGFNVPPISVPGSATPPAVGQQLPFLTAATPDFFRILGLRVIQGRALNNADDRGAPVVLVNLTMANQVWPGQNAVGKCIRIGFDPDFNPETFDPSNGPPMPGPSVVCREVVGVVGDVRQRSVLPSDNEDRLMQYFVPFSQVPKPSFVSNPTHIRGLLLRTQRDVPSLASTVRRLVIADRTDLPYLRVRPYADLLRRQMRPWDIGTRLLGLFSLMALAVSAVGLYAAFAHAVSERLHEMAIRLAIGARPASVRTLVLREALMLAGMGVAIGSMVAVMAGRAGQALLFGTAPFDPIVLGASAALMMSVAAIATLIPATGAASADPST